MFCFVCLQLQILSTETNEEEILGMENDLLSFGIKGIILKIVKIVKT